jgi:hypothetical protein
MGDSRASRIGTTFAAARRFKRTRRAACVQPERSGVLAKFIRDRCQLAPRVPTPKRVLYDAFGRWCDEMGDAASKISAREFSREMATHDPSRITSRKSDVMWWEGIDLLPAVSAPEGQDTEALL